MDKSVSISNNLAMVHNSTLLIRLPDISPSGCFDPLFPRHFELLLPDNSTQFGSIDEDQILQTRELMDIASMSSWMLPFYIILQGNPRVNLCPRVFS